MEIRGDIRKMKVEAGDPVRYYLILDGQTVPMNDLLDKEIEMHFMGQIHCMKCGAETKKSFGQGYCYPCFISAPETEECVLRPELCRAHEGIARDMDYAREHCLIDQVVYLSLTSGMKVGVTRNTQVPARWIDQGATKAIELARTPNRFLAGQIEVELKQHLADKTNWRMMLKGELEEDLDMVSEKERISDLIPEDLAAYKSPDNRVWEFRYPVNQYPVKVRSLNFDKEERITGRLHGLKGQYLLLDDNRVLNVRKFGGYRIQFSTRA